MLTWTNVVAVRIADSCANTAGRFPWQLAIDRYGVIVWNTRAGRVILINCNTRIHLIVLSESYLQLS